MNFDYSLQTKEKKQKQKNSPAINNFYFLVLDYLESWLNLMIVSMFRSESRKVGAFKIVNPKHIDCTPMQNSTLSVLTSLSTGLKYLIVTQKLFSFFFNWDSLHARLSSHYKAWSYKKKKHKKIKSYRKSL